MLSPQYLKAAEDAAWGFFKEHLATGHFSFRDERGKEIGKTEPTPCLPGDMLAVKAPRMSPHKDPIDSIWVVYSNAAGEMILECCLGQGRLNGHHATAFVPRRENITFRQ